MQQASVPPFLLFLSAYVVYGFIEEKGANRDLPLSISLIYFTASLSDLPEVNFGTLAAGMVITSPVLGLRPFLDFLFTTEKVPNPTSVTFCPFFKADLTAFSVESSALDASVLLSPVPEAILSINSALVIYISPLS
jgi:hypothetical protein